MVEFCKKWKGLIDEVPGWEKYLQPIITSDKKWWRWEYFDHELYHLYWIMYQDKRDPDYIIKVGTIMSELADEIFKKSGERGEWIEVTTTDLD